MCVEYIRMKSPMDNLPTVISCCFCCFLRAGTVMIAFVSFFAGLVFAPNINYGYDGQPWGADQPATAVSSKMGDTTVNIIKVILGGVSIFLCCCSVLLIIGALCGMPSLIEVYQWGAVTYCATVCVNYFVLAVFCFFVLPNSSVTGIVLLFLLVLNILMTIYFVIVANSLRLSLKFILPDNSA